MTTLRLTNTLTRTKEDFVPLDRNNVRMYVCGPTVYDYAHIGNARPAIVFDVLFRLLRHIYGPEHVTYVRNITDIDDKINARALGLQASRNLPILDVVRELTVETAKIYQADMLALGNLAPTHEPRATQHIPAMIAMIQALIDAGHAYAADGHVLFDVSSKADYGKLARRAVDDMIAGARVDPAPYKKSPMDFVLWKPSDAQTPGWESPWGFGRPGWHLECSAMSAEYLGETFDIHGGGIDLLFPHHENEIAQSEGAHLDHPLARYWMHNGHLNVEGAKMSKSLGNFVTVHELLKDWPGEVLRLNMLRSHYRQPMDWTVAGLKESMKLLDRWYNVLETIPEQHAPSVHPYFLQALLDDLNSPSALFHLHALARLAEGKMLAGDMVYGDPGPETLAYFLGSARLLGLMNDTPENWKATTVALSDVDEPEIARAIEARNAARKAKNFAEADRIRDELDAKGIVLKDGPQGTTWEVKR